MCLLSFAPWQCIAMFAFGFIIIPVKITLVLKGSTSNQISLAPRWDWYYRSADKTDLRLSLVPESKLYALCYRWAGSEVTLIRIPVCATNLR